MRFTRYLIASVVLLASAWIILLNAQVAAPAINSWTAGSSLSTARTGACAVTMPDGRVLFAGGTGASGVMNTVDILGTNGAFTAGPPMLTGRSNAACALLQDGRVFVSGGNDGVNSLSSSEYFSPTAGTWTSAGSMHAGRYGHTAVVTEMGAVLLMGGRTASGVTAQLEVFRPGNNSFTVLGNLSSSRTDYAVVNVDNHRTLIAGGTDGKSTLSTLDVFDSYTNSIAPAGAMLIGRSNFGAVRLLDGTIMFTGGFDQNGKALASTEIYNADTQTSVAGPNLNVARAGHQSYMLPGNGSVMVFGGTDGQNALSSSETYQPWAGKFGSAAPMNVARNGGSTSLLPGGVVTAGGQNAGGYISAAETFLYSTIHTDKSDYQPGNSATFTGGGWKAGETVALSVTSLSNPTATTEFTGTAVADASGRINLSGFNIDRSHLGMKFLLTAKGSISEAQATFTDADVTSILIGLQGGVYGTGIPTPCSVAPPNCTEPYGTQLGFPFEVKDETTPASAPAGSVYIYDNNISISAAGLSQTFNNPQAASPYTLPHVNPDTGNFSVQVNDTLGISSPGINNFTLQYVSSDTSVSGWDNSTTAAISVQITPVSTVTGITSIAQTINYGAQATLTATVTTQTTVLPNNLQYSLPPEGSLVFSDGTPSDSCAGVRTDGPNPGESTYTCMTPVILPQGTHNYSANYAGVTNIWLTSSSASPTNVPITVLAVNTTTAIVVSPASTPQVYPTPMTITATVTPAAGAGPALGQVNFYDGSNDICGVAVTLVAGSATSCQFILAGGVHSLTAAYTPSSTNFLQSTSGATSFNITPQPTTTVVTGAGTTSLGANATMVATVSCSGTNAVDCGTSVPGVTGEGGNVGTPAGTVNFIDTSNGNVVLNPTPIGLTTSGSNSVASYTTNTLTQGTHNIVAAFTPGTSTVLDWAASDSTASPQGFIVGAVPPTFNISITPPTSPTAYQALTFTVSANSFGGHVPTGTVALTVGGSAIATGQVNLNNGSATFNTSGVNYGTHSIAIAYVAASGETNFSSTGSATVTPNSFTVGSTATNTVVTSSQNSPIAYGTDTTFTATVSPATTLAPGSPAPTGTVTFYDNLVALTNCSNIALNGSGVAQCTGAPLLTAGPSSPHPITAVYTPTAADNDFTGSTSPIFSMSVNPATSTTSISANVNTINLGGSVTYTVTVQGTPAGAGNPAGTVVVTDNGTTIATCVPTLSAANPAVGTCTVAYNGTGGLGGGTHSVIAAFTSTPPNMTGSTSAAITETVTTATFSIQTLTVSATPVVYNNAGTAPTVTIPFTLGLTPPPYPSGNFNIYDGANLIGSVAVPNTSPATYTLPLATYQTVGSHTFYAKYPGDTNFAAATSTGVAFSVTKFAPTVTSNVQVSNNTYGTAATLGGSVNSPNGAGANAAVASGTLTFTFGATSLGTCTLSGGTCTLGTTNTALTAGADSIGIAYNGDANYSSATGTGTLNVVQNTVSVVSPALTTSPAGSVGFGSPLQITVSLIPTGVGSVGTPTGTAIIYDQAPGTNPPPTAIGTVTLSNGIGKLTNSSLVPGNHALYATYSGDTNFAPIASYLNGPTANVTVNQGNTSITLVSSSNPSALNQTVTFSFTVQGGPSAPTGTVSLTDAITGGGAIPSCSTLSLTAGSGNTATGACAVNYNSSDAIHGAGSHPITATYTPTLGSTNWSIATSPLLTEVVGQVAPTITQPAASPTPGAYGVPITYSIVLTPANPSPAYGANTVQFYDSGVPLGGPVSVSNVGTSTFSYGPIVPVGGQHTISAQFLGDANYAASLLSPKLVFTVTKATPNVTVSQPIPSSAPYYSMIGTVANPIGTITVAVPGGNNGVTPTGSVSLIAGTATLATGNISSNGTIVFQNVQLPASLTVNNSPYNLYAQYGGDGNWASTQSTTTSLTITPTPAPVVVTSSNNSPVFGQSVTLTATFNGPGNAVTGSLAFLDGTAVISGCGAAPVANNVATCVTSTLPVGADTISVQSTSLDANHTLGAITTTIVNVGTATTSTSVVSSLNPSTPGVAVSFTATIAVIAPGNGTNTLNGTVNFTWGTATPTTNPLASCSNMVLNSHNSGAQVTCMVPANTAPFTNSGQYLITATYSPALNETNSTSSATITQNVGKPAPTFTSITSSANPSVYGQSVTITATFTVPGSTAPTGTVQFYDGPNTLGGPQGISGAGPYSTSITVPSGSIPAFTGGNHAISALYIPGNNDNYGSDNSATQNPSVILNQQVNQASSNTSASVTPLAETYNTQGLPNAPVYAEQVTFTAVIAPVAPATGNPTGFAIFQDAGTQIGPLVPLQTANNLTTVTLTTSQAGVPNLLVGQHSNITVKYLGDTNFQGSTSAPFPSITVTAAPTKTVLTNIPTTSQQYGSQLTVTGQVCATQVNPIVTNGCISTPYPGFKGTMTFYDGGAILNPGGTPVLVDPNTGIASITVTMTSTPLQAPAVGTHSITATYNGDVDFATSTSGAGQLTVVKGSTTSSVTSTVNPIVTGQSVTFTGQVVAPGSFAAAPTGTVTFMDGGAIIGTAALTTVGGLSTAQFTVPNGVAPLLSLTDGQHVISISYSGDANYASSATALSPACAPGVSQPCALVETVNPASTTTTIASNQNGSITGQQVVLTATVTVTPPGAPVSSGPSAGPTGTVVFTNNATGSTANVLGTGVLTKTPVNGSTLYQATLTLSNITTGLTQITATYSGDVNYLGSASAALNQSVSKVQSQVSLTTSANPSILGMPVVYTITVTPIAPGTGVPTGAVTLFNGSNVVANLTLVGGQVAYTTALGVGSQVLSASYPGDLNFQPSSSQTVNETVNKIQSTLNLTSNVVGAAVASQVITFTAQIQPTPPVGIAYPTGQIGFFMDGATQIGAASLASGVATLSTTLPAGNHQIQAFYIGDNDWTSAQSIYLAQIVGTATTSTQIVSSSNPSVYGQAVVLTVTVAVPYPGTVPANGTVQLYDGGNAIGTPLSANNGTFSTTLTNLGVGTHSIVAQFQANGSFSQSSSAALSQIVNKAPTVTTLAAFPNSSTSNEGVTLTAVVTVPSPGSTAATMPTGTVQFVNTSTSAILGSAPLNLIGGVWTASLNVTSLTAGSQTQLLTATYSGDGNFGTSTSTAQPLSVFTTQIAVVNAAGYTATNFAPNSFAAIFGSNLAYTETTATVTPWPSSLAGTTVTVTDSNGTPRLAPLYYVSLSQINFIIPANTALGLANVTVTNASGETASTIVLISVTSPGLYSENASGQGVAAGYILTVHADGTQSAQSPLFQFNPNTSKYVGVPIVWANSTDQQYLVLYGTGIRGAALNAVTASMNGISVPVLYAGAQPQFLGEDQINLGPIPTSLKGAGTVNVNITVNGQVSNTVTVTIQ